jgi:hypothetical protein
MPTMGKLIPQSNNLAHKVSTVVAATLIAARSSRENSAGERDPEKRKRKMDI